VPTLSSDEVGEEAEARQKALGPMLEEARQLQIRLNEPLAATVPVTNDQFAACAQDAEVTSQVLAVLQSCNQLARLDMDDPKEIGGTVRIAITEELSRLERLVGTAEELARLRTKGPAAELQTSMSEAAAMGVAVVLHLLEALTATDYAGVESASAALQVAFDSYKAPDSELFERIEQWAEPDIDSRLSLVLSKPGPFTDEWGFVDAGKVFGSFAGEERLFGEAEECAKGYFSHLLPESDIAPGEGVMLVFAAITLGVLDRPLLAHRCSRQEFELMRDAQAADAEKFHRVINRIGAEAPRLFAAGTRIEKGFRLLALAATVEEIDEQTAIREVMSAYRELAEGALRAHGRAVLDFAAIASGEKPDEAEQAPPLAELKDRLAASDSELAQAMAAGADPDLRNASAHSQYRWDSKRKEVVDTDTGKRWSVPDLETLTEALIGSVLGADAGFCCFVIGHHLGEKLAAPFKVGDIPQLVELLAQALFAAGGSGEVKVSDGGATISLGHIDRGDLSKPMTALGGISALAPQIEAFQVFDAESGELLLDVPATALVAANDASFETKDLMIITAFYESGLRRGHPPEAATTASLAAIAKVIAVQAMQDFVDAGGPDPSAILKTRERFEYARKFAYESGVNTPELLKVAKKIEKVVAQTYDLARGDLKAFKRLVPLCNWLVAWAEEAGVAWPPTADRP
jgi:hypothetical protein